MKEIEKYVLETCEIHQAPLLIESLPQKPTKQAL